MRPSPSSLQSGLSPAEIVRRVEAVLRDGHRSAAYRPSSTVRLSLTGRATEEGFHLRVTGVAPDDEGGPMRRPGLVGHSVRGSIEDGGQVVLEAPSTFGTVSLLVCLPLIAVGVGVSALLRHAGEPFLGVASIAVFAGIGLALSARLAGSNRMAAVAVEILERTGPEGAATD